MKAARRTSNFNVKRRRDNELIGRRDISKLRIHLRTNEFTFNVVYGRPSAYIIVKDNFKGALNNAILNHREVSTLNSSMKPTISTKHTIDNRKDKTGIKNN